MAWRWGHWCAPARSALAALALGASVASAQMDRPEAARRLVMAWNFEGDDGLFEPVPAGWFRAQDNPSAGRIRPGFPAYNAAVLDGTAAATGRFSMRLPTRGGSTSLTLAAGVLPAIPEGDYTVLARVRTEGLTHARARLAAWFLDKNNQPIASTRSESALVNPGASWDIVEAPLRGRSEAAWIQIELQLLQPEEFTQAPRKPHQVRGFDVSGSAWFDDVVVYQVPRLDLRTGSASNAIVAPQRPALVSSIRDMTGEPLNLMMEVFDLEGKRVDSYDSSVIAVGRHAPWTPALPSFGWYRATMRVSGGRGVVGERWLDFVWLPPRRVERTGGSRAFGLIAEKMSGAQLAALPDLVGALGTGSVTLAAWSEGTRLERLGEEVDRVSAVTERLLEMQQEVTFALSVVPPDLAREARVDRNNPIPVLLGRADDWLPYLSRLLAKFGERVPRWQLGATGENMPFYRPTLAEDVERVLKTLRTLVPRPEVALPWGLRQGFTRSLGPTEALAVSWPGAVGERAIEEAVSAWPEGVRSTLVVQPIDAHRFGRRAAAIDVVRRGVLAWGADVRALSLDDDWTGNPDDESQLMPGAPLAAWRTLAEALTGRRIVGELPVAEGAVALIAEGANDSVLIAWNDWADPRDAVVRGYLGGGEVAARDIFGNARTLTPGSDGGYTVPLTDMPVIIEGIDVQLARFRAGLRFEPRFVPARAEKHRIDLIVENPWGVGISGRLRISKPEDWDISPRVVSLSIGPERTARIPLELSFNLGEEAGLQRVLAEVELVAERRYPLQELPLDLEIGLPSVELLPSLRYERDSAGNPSDVVVLVRIINRSEKPITLEAFAQAPGYKNFFLPVSQLEPAGSTVRVFRFENGATRLRGRSVRVGVKEQDGTGRLNKTITVE
ncbi:MAG TPA: hypothetical protein DEB06_01615 [Phycisphaerales bacterium]|nr:hypothetical protein [Phycisphaerales bacterium]